MDIYGDQKYQVVIKWPKDNDHMKSYELKSQVFENFEEAKKFSKQVTISLINLESKN